MAAKDAMSVLYREASITYDEERYSDVAGSTYNPEHTEFAVVARKR